ncbi:MAG: C69 family dipeptidase [Salinivirgaceae bacterium]|nr:C69 family dipeptidase [Salinivirgaceae bacterium]
MKKIRLLTLTLSLLLAGTASWACTNFIVTKGASTDGSTFISYAADSHVLYGELYFWPAADYKEGDMLKVYEWDTGKYLGEIPQVAHTYNVTGNMNENQVAIGETTYGGRHELYDSTAIMDYGSLIYIGLQRSKNAREAIKVITTLMAKYGYASSGESFSISDPNEVWILELIGKGQENKGAVWVARMIPDGYIAGHANQARITTFPWDNDKTSISSKNIDKIFDTNITTVYAEDVMSFAKQKGYINDKVNKKNFSFSDTYAPVDFGGARFCEIRVWAWFNDVSEGMDQYWDYAKGNITHDDKTTYANNRMPLWVKPSKKISVHDVMNNMRNHLEGTELDMSKDVGAGAYGVPYRWRGLTWKVDDKTYCNERATATQQTGFSFVAHSNANRPAGLGGIIWFGVDDAASSVYTPIYTSINRVPECFKVGNGAMMEFSNKSAFWIFNQVTNFAYTRYSAIHPEIEAKQQALEKKYIAYTPAIELAAAELLKIDKNLAVEFLTDYSVNTANSLTQDWKEFYQYLFVKYMDGNIKTNRQVPEGYKYYTPEVKQPGYGEEFYKRVVKETGEQFLMPGGDTH